MRMAAFLSACVLLYLLHQATWADDRTCTHQDFEVTQTSTGATITHPDLEVTQTSTGATIGGKPEFHVMISNNCICAQSNVEVSCDGLHSTEPVDPRIIRTLADGSRACLLNDGAPIFHGSPLEFTYAWDVSPTFDVITSDISCS